MTSPDRSEERRILREVIFLAHEGGYEGPGETWDSASAATLDQVLEKGEHVPVLKSERFARPFFWNLLHPQMAMLPSGARVEDQPAVNMEEIEAEVAALGEQLMESEDPLQYLKKFLY